MTLTCTISGTFIWRPGTGVLASLHGTGNADVGYSRIEVAGTAADFEAAIVACEKLHAVSTEPGMKQAVTALLRRFRNTVRWAA
jgi:hypothetical protein